LIPVPMVGFKELLRRLQIQEQMTKQHQTRVDVNKNYIQLLFLHLANFKERGQKWTQGHLVIREGILRQIFVGVKDGVQMSGQCSLPKTCFHLELLEIPEQSAGGKGRLNELMSQIRMQNHFGAVRSEERYNVDADLLREIKQHLKQQQEGLSHLISVIKDDLEDIKLIEHGLNDSGHMRGGILS
ncbi:hypothetical protein GOODEAATRI_011534, partial [Goodea atripinnis]